LLTFTNNSAAGTTSVIAAPSPIKRQYDENLKKFLTPSLSKAEALKTKKFGPKLKTYAQVLGIEVANPQTQPKPSQKKNKEKVITKDKEIQLNDEIKALRSQISMMSELIKNLCSTLVKDTNIKNTLLLSLEDIQNQHVIKEKNTNESSKQPISIQQPQPIITERNNAKSNSSPSSNLTKIRKLSPCLTSEQESSGEFQSVANGFQEMKKLKANRNNTNNVE